MDCGDAYIFLIGDRRSLDSFHRLSFKKDLLQISLKEGPIWEDGEVYHLERSPPIGECHNEDERLEPLDRAVGLARWLTGQYKEETWKIQSDNMKVENQRIKF